MAFILVRKNQIPFADLKLKAGLEFKCGRSLSCDIVMDKAQGVSRQHFRIFQENGIWFAELTSKFGILLVDGASVEKIELQEGSIFTIPPYEFEYSTESKSDVIELDHLHRNDSPPTNTENEDQKEVEELEENSLSVPSPEISLIKEISVVKSGSAVSQISLVEELSIVKDVLEIDDSSKRAEVSEIKEISIIKDVSIVKDVLGFNDSVMDKSISMVKDMEKNDVVESRPELPMFEQNQSSIDEVSLNKSSKIELFDEASMVIKEEPQTKGGESKITERVHGSNTEIVDKENLDPEMTYKFLRAYVKVLASSTRDGELLRLEGREWTVGRSKESKIRFKTSEISRKHFEIRKADDKYYIYDLGSVNGSYLNKERLPALELVEMQSGDKMQIGSIKMKFILHDYRDEKNLFMMNTSKRKIPNGNPDIRDEASSSNSHQNDYDSEEEGVSNSQEPEEHFSSEVDGNSELNSRDDKKAWGEIDLEGAGEGSRLIGNFDGESNEQLNLGNIDGVAASEGAITYKESLSDTYRLVLIVILVIGGLLVAYSYTDILEDSRSTSSNAPSFSELNSKQKRRINSLMRDARESFLKGRYTKCLEKINEVEQVASDVESLSKIKDQCLDNRL